MTANAALLDRALENAPEAEATWKSIAAVLASATPRPGKVIVDLGDGGPRVLDMQARTLTPRAEVREEIAATMVGPPGVFATVVRGLTEPTLPLLIQQIKFTGPLELGIRCLNMMAGFPWRPGEDYSNGVPLPSPTTDKALAWRQLSAHGFCVIADAVPPAQLAALKARLVAQAAGERAAGVGQFDGGPPETHLDEVIGSDPANRPNQRVFSLHNKGQVFLDLLDLPILDEFLSQYLGEHYLMSDYQANIAGPGGLAQVLHYDQIGMQPTAPFPLGINAIFPLDDFVGANGATRILPGSHLRAHGRYIENPMLSEGTIPAEAPAGSMILFDSRLWHGTGANTSDGRRHGLICYFVRSWVRQIENGVLAVHPSVHARMTERQRSMYGFRVTTGCGRVQGPPADGFVSCFDPDSLVLEMSATGQPAAG